MQTMPKIDMGTKVSELKPSNKLSRSQDKAFGSVLHDQHRSEKSASQSADSGKKPAVQTAAENQQRDRQVTAKSEKKPRPEAAGSQQAEEAEATSKKKSAQAKSKRDKVQHLLIDLLQTLAAGQNQQPQAGQGKEPASTEDLLQQLVGQFDSTDLQGQQELAGIDLSPLAEQLKQAKEKGGDALKQLAAQLAAALSAASAAQAGKDPAAGLDGKGGAAQKDGLAKGAVAMPAGLKLDADSLASLGKARKVLQQAIDAVAGQQTAANGETDAAQALAEDGEQLLDQSDGKEIDPRFARLLKPRKEHAGGPSLRERVQKHSAAQKPVPQESKTSQPPQQPAAVEVKVQEGEAKVAEQLNASSKQGGEIPQHQVQQGSLHAGEQHTGQNGIKQMPVGNRMLNLPSGQQLAESHIFDEVVSKVSGSFNGESGRMVLRLHPAELGSLKLDLMVEGDKVSANLHAQSQQVQEVLQRHLPQLRNALAEQGLKIDHFQVNVDQHQGQGQQGQFENLAQQQQRWGRQQQPAWRQELPEEEQIIPLAHLMQNGGGGISLHV